MVLALAVATPACYLPPVTAPVVEPFRAPACTYCPANRGLEYRPGAGSRVIAAAAGTVKFRGTVAGVRYLVVEQGDGRTATYGYLATMVLGPGDTVRQGELVGTSTDRFYFGLRQGGRYVDPGPFIGTPRHRPRLIPVDGSPPRRPPPPVISCASTGAHR